jgi:RNA polymerase sigma-70 factor (ECF subfamily)
MNAEESEVRWRRLAGLLEPIHARANATARRLTRTPMDGDDLYQETVLRAFAKLHTLRDESRFRSWFFAMLLRLHRSRHRLRFWRRLVPLEEEVAQGRDPIGADGSSWDEEARRAKRAALALESLAAVQREAVVLFEIEGYSIEEISAMQRVSISAVKSRLARGRERLRRVYEARGWLDRERETRGDPATGFVSPVPSEDRAGTGDHMQTAGEGATS